jgi:hypothetical protein
MSYGDVRIKSSIKSKDIIGYSVTHHIIMDCLLGWILPMPANCSARFSYISINNTLFGEVDKFLI